MRTVYIDEAGSLHPKSKDEYFILVGVCISNYHIRALQKAVKKALKGTIFSEFKTREIENGYKIKLLKMIEKLDLEYLIIYIEKEKIKKIFKKFEVKLDNLVRAKGISLIAEYFVKKHKVITDVIFDKIFSKKISDAILKFVKETHIEKRDYVRYRWQDSHEDRGLQVADCIANTLFKNLDWGKELFKELKSKMIIELELNERWLNFIKKNKTKRKEAPSHSTEASSHIRFIGYRRKS